MARKARGLKATATVSYEDMDAFMPWAAGVVEALIARCHADGAGKGELEEFAGRLRELGDNVDSLINEIPEAYDEHIGRIREREELDAKIAELTRMRAKIADDLPDADDDEDGEPVPEPVPEAPSAHEEAPDAAPAATGGMPDGGDDDDGDDDGAGTPPSGAGDGGDEGETGGDAADPLLGLFGEDGDDVPDGGDGDDVDDKGDGDDAARTSGRAPDLSALFGDDDDDDDPLLGLSFGDGTDAGGGDAAPEPEPADDDRYGLLGDNVFYDDDGQREEDDDPLSLLTFGGTAGGEDLLDATGADWDDLVHADDTASNPVYRAAREIDEQAERAKASPQQEGDVFDEIFGKSDGATSTLGSALDELQWGDGADDIDLSVGADDIDIPAAAPTEDVQAMGSAWGSGGTEQPLSRYDTDEFADFGLDLTGGFQDPAPAQDAGGLDLWGDDEDIPVEDDDETADGYDDADDDDDYDPLGI